MDNSIRVSSRTPLFFYVGLSKVGDALVLMVMGGKPVP
jgi:hypothetical protein